MGKIQKVSRTTAFPDKLASFPDYRFTACGGAFMHCIRSQYWNCCNLSSLKFNSVIVLKFHALCADKIRFSSFAVYSSKIAAIFTLEK
jgi:hypothetical protein